MRPERDDELMHDERLEPQNYRLPQTTQTGIVNSNSTRVIFHFTGAERAGPAKSPKADLETETIQDNDSETSGAKQQSHGGILEETSINMSNFLSHYTTYLANRLCGGSSRKLIAGWWYVVSYFGLPFRSRHSLFMTDIQHLTWYTSIVREKRLYSLLSFLQ